MRIVVLGRHEPWLDEQGIRRFATQEASSFERTIKDLRARGLTDASDSQISARALELPDEIVDALHGVTVFEIEVTENSSFFESNCFWDKHSECQALEQRYLDSLGAEIVSEDENLPPDVKNFRVVACMHDWPSQGELVGPTGSLVTPSPTRMPERLWRFVPYTLLD